MAMLLKEYELSARASHNAQPWEILHEEVGFIDFGWIFDRDLSDLDGAETHLSHSMESHAVEPEDE